jgi:phosphatidylserine/phosphatidylglycerophosphate/cardiolipin synthase-like enzyme
LDSLKYLGTSKGQIIKAIAVEDLRKWGEIRDNIGLTDDQLRTTIRELKSEGLLEERYNGFWVDYDLWLAYKAYFGDDWAKKKIAELEEEREEQERLTAIRIKRESETHLMKRIQEWIKFKKLDIEPDCSHIYLKGDLLDSLVSDLIPLTRKEILVVNPYVEKCSLCDLIITAGRKGLDVKLITQSPATDYDGRRKRAKINYHNTIKDSNIQFYYNESVHAKLFILDNQVLTASSMNLYSESVAGKLWEAGIVTTEVSNIKLAKESFDQLLIHPDTNLQNTSTRARKK